MHNHLILILLSLTFTACLDPTAPTFQLEEPFYLVEGQILAGGAESEVRVRESSFGSALLRFSAITGARVTSREAAGLTVEWEAVAGKPGSYRPPAGFVAEPGQMWSVEVVLPDGTVITSDPEEVPATVPVTDFSILFEQNSVFDEGLNRFVPRFELYLDYDDPADVDNFYAYDFRYWEEVIICASCERGRWRGECIEDLSVRRYDYYCDTDECYRETAGNQTVYGNDRLSDGGSITGFPLGGITFDSYGGLLVEGILLSISEAAFAYGEVIEDLTTGNTGLNATTPAALNGNVRNTDPEGQTALGYVRVAAASRQRAFIVRDVQTGTPLPADNSIRPEPSAGPFVPPLAPCEVDGRTAERPEGWGG